MDELDFELIMRSMSNITSEINNTFASFPMDNNLNMSAPIDDINAKLRAFRNLINIAHLNAVSIPLHRDEIFRLLLKINFDIVGFSETNIKKNTPSYLFNFKGYKMFHTDREGKCGGVGIIIKSEMAKNAKKSMLISKKRTQSIFSWKLK